MAITLIIVLILGIVGAIAVGGNILDPFLSILENATSIIGIVAAITGVFFLISIYKKSKKEEDKWLGIIMILVGAGIAIGGIFLDILRLIFSNTLFMILIVGGILIVYFKREGIIE